MSSTGTPAIPPRPTAPPSTGGVPYGSVVVRVDKRLLWVGNAAYPLNNVTRVCATALEPDRRAALHRVWMRFLAFAAFGVVIVIATTNSYGNTDEDVALTVAGLLTAYLLCDALRAIAGSSVPVLLVDTAGGPTAVVTSSDRRRITELLDILTHTLENPDHEFRYTMQRVTVNPRYYQIGDNINLYGGSGNAGKVLT
ncbi:DUF6232 family protein [Kitasatospora sp. NPDC001664]|uniref:DUF6232 family protein n=1 Tax=Kitasatospora albolonga TaxID=68173 RepID=UPI0031E4F64C